MMAVWTTFKEGAAYIAIRAGVPLVPIALERHARGSAVRIGARPRRTGDDAHRRSHSQPLKRNCAIESRSPPMLRERIVSLLEDQPIHA